MMNDIAKKFFNYRIILLVVLLIISIITSIVVSNSNIVKTDFTIYLNDDSQGVFGYYFEESSNLNKHYNYTTDSNPKNADFIFTTNINDINTNAEYSTQGYTPLVVCFRNNENLNNYLKTKTEKGFLTCSSSSKIKNSYSDAITCDFSRIIEAILNNQDWSYLGGEDNKITIYCPESGTVSGDLFYDFLLITINNGKYPTNNLEQVKEKANAFLNSENVIQTNVASKISMLNGLLQPSDIYVLFESDLIFAGNGNGEISITYPKITVIRQFYLQYNNFVLKESLSEDIANPGAFSLSLNHILHNTYYYRTTGSPSFIEGNSRYYNSQKGFNFYDLTN